MMFRARASVVFGLTVGTVLLLACPGSVSAKIYKGAEYRTKASYLYGRFETKTRTIGREGTLSSFFTYNDDYPNTSWNEIDIEVLGRYSDDVQFNAITPGQTNHVSHRYVPFNPAADFHVYGFEWTPDYVAWFIDSVEVCRQTGQHISTLTLPQKIMMNVWIPAQPNWVGTWSESVLPGFASYDWVRYASYTPGAGSVGTGNNFTPEWTDDFASWDTTRWEKGNHTFGGNDCDFIPDNAVFTDGNLVLCLTKQTAIGYTDAVAPSVRWARVEKDGVRLMFSEDVDQGTAQTPSNYVLPGRTVQAAQLRADLKTVFLTVPGVDTTTASALIVQNVRDRWSIPNPMPMTPVSLIRSTPLTLPVRINAGGPAVNGYLADQEWGPTVEYGRLDGMVATYPGAVVAGGSDSTIYETELYGQCEYRIRVPNGRYDVRLLMAENYFSNPGERVMSVVVQGQRVLSGLDLVAQKGVRVAYEPVFTADVIDGVIDIHAEALVSYAVLNGIIVTTSSTGVREETSVNPLSYGVVSNYPNPFNGGTTIAFDVPRDERLTLRVFDTLGREVAERHLGFQHRGLCQFYWDGRADSGATLSSGVYYYCVEGVQRSPVQRMVYLK